KVWDPRRAAVSGFGVGGGDAHPPFGQDTRPEDKPPAASAPPRPGRSAPGGLKGPRTPQKGVLAPEKPGGGTAGAVPRRGARGGAWGGFGDGAGGGAPRARGRRRSGGGGAADRGPPGHYIEELHVPLDRFRIPPKELEEMLPQQVLMLQAAAAALDDAGAKTG